MGRTASEFTASVKRQLERRVASVCSKPTCGRITTGPKVGDPGASVSVGDAAHITAAAKNGPRYDASLTAKQRKSASNGIWLCCACHRIVDHDDCPYPVEELRRWKNEAEARVRDALELGEARDRMPDFMCLLHRSMEFVPDGSLTRSIPLLFRSADEVTADCREACALVDQPDLSAVVLEQLRARDEVWKRLDAIPGAELAYYGIAHVPLAIHMGFLLGTRVSASHAERDRDGPGWRWLKESGNEGPHFDIARDEIAPGTREVAVSVSLTYGITREQILGSVPPMPIVALTVPRPSLDLVQCRPQVEGYSRQFRGVLEELSRVQSLERIHLFAATPMSLSFALGRQVRATVHPQVIAYNYRRGASKPYPWGLQLTDRADSMR